MMARYCFNPDKKLPKIYNFLVDSIQREMLFFIACHEEDIHSLSEKAERIRDRIISLGFSIVYKKNKKNDLPFPIRLGQGYVKIYYSEKGSKNKKNHIIFLCHSDYALEIVDIFNEEFFRGQSPALQSVKPVERPLKLTAPDESKNDQVEEVGVDEVRAEQEITSDPIEEVSEDESSEIIEPVEEEVVEFPIVSSDLPPPSEDTEMVEISEEHPQEDGQVVVSEDEEEAATPETSEPIVEAPDQNDIVQASFEVVEEDSVEAEKHTITINTLDYYHEQAIRKGETFDFPERFHLEVLPKSSPQTNLPKKTEILYSDKEEDKKLFMSLLDYDSIKEIFMVVGFNSNIKIAERVAEGHVPVPMKFVEGGKSIIFENRETNLIGGLRQGFYVVKIPK